MARPATHLRDVERERARARSARRLLPWAVASAVCGGVLAMAAGAAFASAISVAAVGLVFAAFAWMMSIARCPACGSRLPAENKRPDPYRGTGPAEVERFVESCPQCRARFE
jgi:hypothetical protein